MWSVVDRQVCVSVVSSEYAFEEIQPKVHLGLLKTLGFVKDVCFVVL